MDLMRLVAELDDLLEVDSIQDYCPNGLQVEGRHQVSRIVSAVSASRALFTRAADLEADLVLVHHGVLWKAADPPRLVGSFRERVRLLMLNEISLVAYHLPLDLHPRLGNAAQLARNLGLAELEPFGDHNGTAVGVSGVLPSPIAVEELIDAVTHICQREPVVFEGSREMVSSVGIITGRSPNTYHEAVAADLDAFITGEPAEWAMHQAAEDGVHYLAAGHYATERFGILALGRWIQDNHHLNVDFIELRNPV